MKVINPFSHVLDNQMNEIVLYLLKQIALLQEKVDALQNRLDEEDKFRRLGRAAAIEDDAADDEFAMFRRDAAAPESNSPALDGDGFAPAGDEYDQYGDFADDVRRGYLSPPDSDEAIRQDERLRTINYGFSENGEGGGSWWVTDPNEDLMESSWFADGRTAYAYARRLGKPVCVSRRKSGKSVSVPLVTPGNNTTC